MEISANLVKELREKTGAGMMDCKKALAETSGDFDKAIEFLRKKGMASAAKKAGRATKDGTVFSFSDSKATVLVEINCETDFVAKTEQFKDFVTGVATHIASANPSDLPTLMSQKYFSDSSKTVEDKLKETIATLGENMVISRFARYPAAAGNSVKSYIHAGGKVGVLVEFSVPGKENDAGFQEYARTIAMHVAAAMPTYLQPSDVPADVVAKEKEIAMAQMNTAGKPEAVIAKISEGKVNKFYEENCLVKQAFVMDPAKSIEKYTAETSKTVGATITIKRFERFVLGQGVKTTEEAVH